MQSSLTSGSGPWLEPVIVLAVGTAVVVGVAALAARLVRSPIWRRTIWQAATLGLLALLLVELTGTASALVGLARPRTRRPSVVPSRANAAMHQRQPGQAGRSEVVRAPEQDILPAVATTATEHQPFGQRRARFAAAGLAHPRWSAAPAEDLAESAPPEEAGFDGAVALSGRGRPFEQPDYVRSDNEIEPPAPPLGAKVVEPNFAFTGAILSEGRSLSSNEPPSAVTAVGQWVSQDVWWPPGTVWWVGAVVILGRFAWARLVLMAFRRRQPAVRDEALSRRVAGLARRLGLRRPIVVVEAAGLTTPVAFGSFRPTLALPTAFAREFDPRQQEAMIVHELAHLSARDPAWQSVADLASALLWWHPLAWWSRRRLRAASEAAADEASLLIPEGPDLLASCLVVFGKRLAGRRPRLGWLSVEGPGFRSGLARRVERLLGLASRSWQPPRRRSLVLAKTTLPVALVIVAVLCTAWAHPRVTLAEGETAMNVLKTSWRRSLAAAVVAAVLVPIPGDVMSQDEREQPVPDLFQAASEEGRESGERPSPEREALKQQIEILRRALPALREGGRGDAVETVERAIRAREVILEGRRDDEAHQIRERAPSPGQLAEILRVAADLWRELDNADKAEVVAKLAEQLAAQREGEREAEREGEREREPVRDRQRDERVDRRNRNLQVQRLQAEFRDLAARSAQIKGELEGLRDDQDEEARELQGTLQETRERMEDIARELADLSRDQDWRDIPEREREERERPDREGWAQRLNELQKAYERAREAGREEEAERIKREMEDIRQESQRRVERRERDVPRPEGPEEMERRMHHVRAAVENLHAAGLHEQAEQLARELDRWPGDRPDRDSPPLPRLEFASRGEGPPPPEQIERRLAELSDVVHQLQMKMEELTQHTERRLGEIRAEMEAMGRGREDQVRQLMDQIRAGREAPPEREREKEAEGGEIPR